MPLQAFAPLDSDRLAAFEAEVGPLPAGYRTFLTHSNGGRATEMVCQYDSELCPDDYDPAFDGLEINEFFGLGTGERPLENQARALHRQLAQENKQLPPEWIWIGSTVHDDALMLAISGAEAGAVFLLFACDEFFSEDFDALFVRGRLETEDLLVSKDFTRFLHSG